MGEVGGCSGTMATHRQSERVMRVAPLQHRQLAAHAQSRGGAGCQPVSASKPTPDLSHMLSNV